MFQYQLACIIFQLNANNVSKCYWCKIMLFVINFCLLITYHAVDKKSVLVSSKVALFFKHTRAVSEIQHGTRRALLEKRHTKLSSSDVTSFILKNCKSSVYYPSDNGIDFSTEHHQTPISCRSSCNTKSPFFVDPSYLQSDKAVSKRLGCWAGNYDRQCYTTKYGKKPR